MIYGYARVSTKGQAKDGNGLEVQEEALRAAGAEEIYKDSCSGTTMERPELERLLKKIKGGDTLVVTKLDRIGRSVSGASELITELLERDVSVNVLNIGMLSNDSIGQLTMNILLAFAQFERDMIIERTQEGRDIKRRTDPDYKEGRKPKYSKAQRDHWMELLKENSYDTVAKMTGVSRITIIREAKNRGISKK